MIKTSGKFKGKDYYHAELKITFDRIFGGIGWPGERPGFVVILGEKKIDRETHRFILAEASCDNFGGLLKDALKLQRELKVTNWYTRHVPGSEEYLSVFDSKAFEMGKPGFGYIDDAPGIDDKIQMGVELIKDNVLPGNKTLHFFTDSSLPAELQGLPSQVYKLTNLDYPAVAALGYVLSYMEEFANPEPYVLRPNSAY
jgi:hypothetical protein